MKVNSMRDISLSIRKALNTFSMLPPVRVQGAKSTWPDYISEEHLKLSQLLKRGLNGYELSKINHQTISFINDNPIKEKPLALEISEADKVLSWFSFLEIHERLLVWNFNRIIGSKGGIKLKTCEALAESIKNSQDEYIRLRTLDDLSFYYGCKGRSGLYYKYNMIVAKLFNILKRKQMI